MVWGNADSTHPYAAELVVWRAGQREIGHNADHLMLCKELHLARHKPQPVRYAVLPWVQVQAAARIL